MNVDYSLQEQWKESQEKAAKNKKRYADFDKIDYSLLWLNEDYFEERVRKKFRQENPDFEDPDIKSLGFVNPQNTFYNLVFALRSVASENYGIAFMFIEKAANPFQDGETTQIFLAALNGLTLAGLLEIEDFQANLDKACTLYPSDKDVLEYVSDVYRKQFGDFTKAFQIAMRIKSLSNDGTLARNVLEEIAWEYG